MKEASAVSASGVEVLAHLAVALSRYLKEAAREGRGVPAELVAVLDFATDAVRERQGAPTVGVCADPDHAGGMSAKLLLTRREVANLLGVSMRTLERRIAAGELPLVMVGGVPRVRRADLDKYVAGLGPRTFRDTVEAKGAAS